MTVTVSDGKAPVAVTVNYDFSPMSFIQDDTTDVQSVSSDMTVAEFAEQVAYGVGADDLNEAADLTIEEFGEWSAPKQMLVLGRSWNGTPIEILNAELAAHSEIDRSDVRDCFHGLLIEGDNAVEFIENNPDVAEDVALLRGMTVDDLIEARSDWNPEALEAEIREDLSNEELESLGYDTDGGQ